MIPEDEGNTFIRNAGSHSPKNTASFISQEPESSAYSLLEDTQGQEQNWANHLKKREQTAFYGWHHSVIDPVDDRTLDDQNHDGNANIML
jgi:hypothetical protein